MVTTRTARLRLGSLETPLGVIWLAASDAGLRVVTVPGSSREACLRLAAGGEDGAAGDDSGLIAEAAAQLSAYFGGRLRRFDLPLDLHGTPFQLRVWDAVRQVRYGETATYADIAQRIGAPRAYRAVGAANGANPAAIVVPCHRLIGSDGDLRGYGGGLHQKRALLALEASAAASRLADLTPAPGAAPET